MTVPDRESNRDQLVTLITNGAFFNDVYAYEVKDLKQVTKVCTVHSDSFTYERAGAGDGGGAEHYERFWITWWINRDDAAQAEDDLDAAAQTIAQIVEDNRNVSGQWEDLNIVGESQPGYVVVEGVQYRRERVLVEALILT